MILECPDCGTTNNPGSPECLACAHRFRPPLAAGVVLVGASGRLRMHVSTTVGRALLRSARVEDGAYASDEQFRVVRDEGAAEWRVMPCAGAKNPTFHNGAPLPTEGAALSGGDVLGIGPERCRLVVEWAG